MGLGFVKVAESVWRGEEIVTTDARLHLWLLRHREPWLTDIMRVVTDLGGVIVITGVTIAVTALALHRRRPDAAVFMVSATLGSFVIVQITKAVVARPRPATIDRAVSVSGAAFPSGHAASSLACYGAVAVLIAWTWRSRSAAFVGAVALLVVAVLVGASRVYLGVHWPSDVLAGWAIAASWLAALVAAQAAASVIRLGRRVPGSGGPDSPVAEA